MMKPKAVIVLLACSLIIAVATAVSTLQANEQNTSPANNTTSTNPSNKQYNKQYKQKPRFKSLSVAEIQSQYPTVDLDEPEDDDPVKRAKRQLKSRRYDAKLFVKENPSKTIGESVRIDESSTEIPAIPTAQSKVVVVGEVVGSKAHLSNDKTGVYTEITFRISEVIKSGDLPNIAVGSLITAEREGGIVKHAPDNSRLYRIEGKGMPSVGRRYVLFLSTLEHDFAIVTGYELRSNKILPLDTSPQFREYEDADESVFLKAIRDSIT